MSRRKAPVSYSGLDTSDVSDEDFEVEDEVSTPKRRKTTSPRKQTPRRTASPRKAPGTPSPVKRSLHDKSARKKANRTLLDQSLGLVSEDEDEIELAERIIGESRAPILDSSNDFHTDERSLANVGALIAAEDRVLFLDSSEGYFDQHKTRGRGNANTMAKAPAIDHSVFFKYTNQANELFHADQKKMLRHAYRGMFSQWIFELSEGFSLLFYGLGSKRELLTDFVCEKVDSEIPILVINGYNASVQFKSVLNSVVDVLYENHEDIFAKKGFVVRNKLPKDVDLLVKLVVDTMRDIEAGSKPSLVVLCHNVDGESLRIDKASTHLSQLMSISQIWFVASVDHIMAPLMWDSAKLASYNFVWHDVTTFAPYTVETSFDDPLLLGKKAEAQGAKGVKYVLESVTPNHRSLYKNLIYCQLEEFHNVADKRKLPEAEVGALTGSTSISVDYDKVLTECLNELTVSNKKDFQEKLKEFMDHKMVVAFDDKMGMKKLYIPSSKDVVQQILEGYLDA
ncbi:YALIA101S06e05402g1_1 [Yarrowia lipolytica]|nr:Origin recognition complex subunit 2 [Yarrowia lipolytica]SEI35244.1 YALIA101S06e05402g1_1 [Yarrowia lipolytica]